MKIACLQMCSGTDQQANADQFEALARKAADAGALYVQSPEMSGLVQKDRAQLMATVATPGDTPLLKCAERLANELGVIIHVGSCAVVRADGKLANRAFVFVPNAIKPITYDKIHMFDVDLPNGESWRESAVYEAGNKSVVCDLDYKVKLGLGICYDLRFAHLFRGQAQSGANVLTSPACFTVPTGKAHWEVLIRARAIENSAFMVCAAQGGSHEDGRKTWGRSMIADPWGKVQLLDHDKPDLLLADLDLNAVTEARARVPAWQQEAKFEDAIN